MILLFRMHNINGGGAQALPVEGDVNSSGLKMGLYLLYFPVLVCQQFGISLLLCLWSTQTLHYSFLWFNFRIFFCCICMYIFVRQIFEPICSLQGRYNLSMNHQWSSYKLLRYGPKSFEDLLSLFTIDIHQNCWN